MALCNGFAHYLQTKDEWSDDFLSNISTDAK